MEPLKYQRSTELLRRATQNPPDEKDYFCARNGVRWATGDGTLLVFLFDITSAWWNAEDLNRIERASKYLQDRLAKYGYSVDIAVKVDWNKSDLEGLEAGANRIRRNVDALQNGFYHLPDWREILYTEQMDYEQANTIEWNLTLLDVSIDRMIEAFFYAGEVYCGEV